jgi:hypothetical protein
MGWAPILKKERECVPSVLSGRKRQGRGDPNHAKPMGLVLLERELEKAGLPV